MRSVNSNVNSYARKALTYSFEFFPPKDVEGEERLWAAMSQLESIAPDFISVTYGAGGSTRDRTIRITSEITARTHIPTVAHLTCVGSTRAELVEILGKYRDAGIKSILALRGDPSGGRQPKVDSIMQMSWSHSLLNSVDSRLA
jgi:methylenetetrahydrofolate reductase (NADPH)